MISIIWNWYDSSIFKNFQWMVSVDVWFLVYSICSLKVQPDHGYGCAQLLPASGTLGWVVWVVGYRGWSIKIWVYPSWINQGKLNGLSLAIHAGRNSVLSGWKSCFSSVKYVHSQLWGYFLIWILVYLGYIGTLNLTGHISNHKHYGEDATLQWVWYAARPRTEDRVRVSRNQRIPIGWEFLIRVEWVE